MFSFRHRPDTRPDTPRSKASSLDCIPVKNPDLTEHTQVDGDICLTYPVRVKPWFQGIFKTVSGSGSDILERKLQLDGLGSSVWQMIDGEKSVMDIILAFQAEHKLNRREAEISVSAFMKQLGKRGILAMREGKR